MPKPKIIREWTELSGTYLEPYANRGVHEAMLFTNTCQLRQTAKGLKLLRSTGITTLTSPTRDGLDQKIADFALREDVRRLAEGIESNDFDTLPKEQLNPPESIIDGTDELYATAEEDSVSV